MATSGQSPSSLSPLPKIPQDMGVLFWSLSGALHLAPMTARSALTYTCQGKSDAENYRAYAEKIRGKKISDEEWRKWCNFSASRLENENNPERMDLTALSCFLNTMWIVCNESEVVREKSQLPKPYVSNQSSHASTQTDFVSGLITVNEASKKDQPFKTGFERTTKAKNIATNRYYNERAINSPVINSQSLAINVKKIDYSTYYDHPRQSHPTHQCRKRRKSRSSNHHRLVRNVAVQARDISWVVQKEKVVKNIRNDIVHDETAAKDPTTFGKLLSALQDLINELGQSFCLTQNQVQLMKDELNKEINRISCRDGKDLAYVCSSLLTSGREKLKDLWSHRFSYEQLMFDVGKVQRKEVFCIFNVVLREDDEGKVLVCSEILNVSEKFIVLSGIAGSGKTTFLKYLALNFFESGNKESGFLKSFSLLLYIDCKNRTATTLNDTVEEQFEDLCDEFTTTSVVKALFRLDALVLIDAFDEANPQSTAVLRELIQKARRANCRVIITTRPQAIKVLGQLLSASDVRFSECEILPLTKLEDQLNFLRKYDFHLSDSPSRNAIQTCFMQLNESVRGMFTEAVNLVLFCDLVLHRRERIEKLTTPTQVAQEIFLLYRTLVERKLSGCGYPNLNVIIDEQFLIIGQLALRFLGEGSLSFTENEVLQLQRQCWKELVAVDSLRGVDTGVFLSVVLKMQRPLLGRGPATYTFHHTSVMERFAAKYVTQQLLDTTEPVQEILGVPEASNVRFLEVLQYVVQDLNACSPSRLKQRWPEMKKALEEAGIVSNRREDWESYMLRFPDVIQIAWQFATDTAAKEKTWKISTERDLAAVALMLPHAQPSVLEVVTKQPDDLVGTHWSDVAHLRYGALRLFLSDEIPCDELLGSLHSTKCRLVSFRGLITTSAGVAALASIATPATELYVWLVQPLQLSILEGLCVWLSVRKKPCKAAKAVAVPLPARPAPELYLEKVQRGAWDATADTLHSFAPSGKRYHVLGLKNNNLTDAEIDRLLVAVQSKGIRTESQGETRYQATHGGTLLHITDKLPARLANVRSLLEMCNRVIELSCNYPERLQADLPGLRADLRVLGASPTDWLYLMRNCPRLADLSLLTAERKMAQEYVLRIRPGMETHLFGVASEYYEDEYLPCSGYLLSSSSYIYQCFPPVNRKSKPIYVNGNFIVSRPLPTPSKTDEIPYDR